MKILYFIWFLNLKKYWIIYVNIDLMKQMCYNKGNQREDKI